MKAKELQELTKEELEQKLEALRRELFVLRQKMKTGKFEKFAQIRQMRKDVARILTVMKPRFAECPPSRAGEAGNERKSAG